MLVLQLGRIDPSVRINNTTVLFEAAPSGVTVKTKVTARVQSYSVWFDYTGPKSERLWLGAPIDSPEDRRMVLYQLRAAAVETLLVNYPALASKIG